MQTWYLSRFQVEPQSVMAMSLMKIAGGCNFVGYYMFHGGTNPVGKTGYLNESTTPRITYDFQAPIGEFGQIRDSSHLLRPLHYFLRQFAEGLMPMATVLPQNAVLITPEDAHTLRYAVRTDGRSGFLFVNNYQDHVEMDTHEDVRFEVELAEETCSFPNKSSLTVRQNASFIFPFNFALDGLNLRYATAQPVTVMESAEAATYFFAMPEGVHGEFLLSGQGVTGLTADGGAVEKEADGGYSVLIPHDGSAMIRITRDGAKELRIYVMNAKEASTLWELKDGQSTRIIFSEIPLVQTAEGIELFSTGQSSFSFWEYAGELGAVSAPEWKSAQAACSIAQRREEWFLSYDLELPVKEIGLKTRQIHEHKLALHLASDALSGVEEVLLSIQYTGNVGYAFAEGQLFHDHFYNGLPWEIGLSRFRDTIQGREIILETTPLRKGVKTVVAGAAVAAKQQFTGERAAVFHSVTAVPVYRVALTR